LQRVLEPDRSEYDPPFFLRSEGPWLHLAVGDQLTVDATSFDHEVRQGAHADRRGIPSQALAAYQRAVGLYRGDYLADAGAAEWALVERDRLRLAYTTTAVRAGELLIGHGDSEQALRLGHRALHADRWSEAAYRLLAAAYVATGDRDAARRVLRHCRRMLRDLGVEPGPETLQLERRLTHPSNRRTP
jgi:DNA-binding SARP family transcriptional activator